MDRLEEIYKGEAYEKAEESERSAREIVPFLYKLLRPKSVVDVGGGIGVWLEAFVKIDRNIKVCCIDGQYVKKNYRLDTDTLLEKDLEESLFTGKRFDLSISLEVAEHLSEKRAAGFVEDLTNLSDIVMFSAAVDFQPGDNHINCRKSSYWENLFRQRGYQRIDCVRPVIAKNPDVVWWYKNNIFLYVKETIYDDIYRKISDNGMTVWDDSVGDFIHYECFYNIVRMQRAMLNASWRKKTDLLLKWMEFNKTGSVAAWLNCNLGDSEFALFGLGDCGKKFLEEIQDSESAGRLNAIIDNYARIEQWMGKRVTTLDHFLANNAGVEIIINTVINLDENIKNKIENRGMQVIDLTTIISGG